MKKINFLILLLTIFTLPALNAFCQKNNNAFNFQGDIENDYNIEKKAVTLDYSEVDIYDRPDLGGIIILSKTRWKNWVARAIYIVLINILLVILILSLPKNNEPNIIISYLISGSSFIMSFWIFLCSVLLFRLKAIPSAIIFLPVAFTFFAATYILLLKIKKSDISLTELKESFQKLNKTSSEDARLVSVSGLQGDWPDEDFVK
ncbi:MAG: hypothetical protein L6420_10255 [Elusimicrobia bacterium]|nr:hypothetical protein [Elusimicrobiota bacterium]